MSRQAVLNRLLNATPLIAPSMLKCDFGNLRREMELLESADVSVLHLDVMDGHFVPNLSYGPVVIERLRELTDLPFDAHLMISDPDRYLADFLAAGCDCVTIHIEAVPKPGPLLERIREQDACSGLALNPGTPVEAIRPYLSLCDLVLVMSVEPGFGGQKFQPVALDKLRRLREWIPQKTLLSVDGGIGPATIGEAAEAGAGVFVVGSAIFDTPDYGDAVRALSGLVRDESHAQPSGRASR
jgi:ribulose-phosphate 3-epimerase